MAFRKGGESLLYGCCCLGKMFRRTCVGKPNSSVGLIIKELNKENKSLFGKLIETRKERRKNISKVNGSSVNDVEATVSDVFLNSSSHKTSKDLLPRAEVRILKSKKTTVEESSKLVASGDNVVLGNDENENSKSLINDNSSADLQASKINIPSFESESSFSEKHALNKQVLPLVVAKNIDKYPMMNRAKNVEENYSLKDFDNLKISNRHISRIYPSVTKVLNATMSENSKMLLKKWRERMIAELGEDGFNSFYKAQLNSGCQFHTAIQSFLRGTRTENLLLDGQGVEGCWKSLSPIIINMKNVKILEGPVCHSSLLYHGVLDCVAQFQGKQVLIEWKKSDKPKPTLQKTYDAPIQLSAYIGALNFDKNYPIQIDGGIVVVAYSDGTAAETFHLDLPQCYYYWKIWLQRLQSFWNQYYESQSMKSNFLNSKEI